MHENYVIVTKEIWYNNLFIALFAWNKLLSFEIIHYFFINSYIRKCFWMFCYLTKILRYFLVNTSIYLPVIPSIFVFTFYHWRIIKIHFMIILMVHCLNGSLIYGFLMIAVLSTYCIFDLNYFVTHVSVIKRDIWYVAMKNRLWYRIVTMHVSESFMHYIKFIQVCIVSH